MSDTNDSAAGALPLDDHGSSGKKQELNDPDTPKTAADLEKLFDVPVKVSAILGRSRMPVAELLKLEEGAVIELDRRVGEAIDIYVNDRLVARGEVVLVDNKLGVTMTEIIKTNN
jgi:flagellar motor switch protein FliN/FliY